MNRPDYCPCTNEQPDPCPACGATVANGTCRALYRQPPPSPAVTLTCIHRDDLKATR